MPQNDTMTSANIRYLLAIKSLHDAGRPVRGVRLASMLAVRKSSVHSMLEVFLSRGWIEKSADGQIRFTEQGLDVAERYQAYYDRLRAVLHPLLPPLTEIQNAVCALLAEIPEADLRNMKSAVQQA